MGHTVGDQAAKAVKKSEKRAADAQRTPEQRLAAIRGSLAAKLFVTPEDQRFLLDLLDQATTIVTTLKQLDQHQAVLIVDLQAKNAEQSGSIGELQSKLEEFRTVYEQENRSTKIKIERVSAGDGLGVGLAVMPETGVEPTHHEPFIDRGGEA
jgi:hypothetical protein